MKKIVFLPMLILLTLFLTPLGAKKPEASITATYDPDSYVIFTAGTYPFESTDFVAHLGTLTLTILGNQLFNPSLVDLSIPTTFSITGPILNGDTYTQQTTGATLCSVCQAKNVPTISILIPPQTTLPLSMDSGNFNTSVFVAELYVLGEFTINKYKEGELYTLTGGNLGSFNVGVADNGGSSTDLEYISVNDQEISDDPDAPPPPPIPISPVATEPLPYVDPDPTSPDVQYLLSIIEQASFDIQDVLQFNATPTIARAMLVLHQAVAGETYGVNIQFSKLSGSSSFALRPEGNPLGHAIHYQLSFKGQPVIKDNPIEWAPLSSGLNFEYIRILSVTSAEANAAPSGTYEDTIVVTIAPIDTV